MKFPITRDTLQQFNYSEEIVDKANEEFSKTITVLLENLTKEFTQQMRGNTQTKKFVWNEFRSLNYIVSNYINQIRNARSYDSINFLGPDEEKNIKEVQQKMFVQRLQELFIRCDIIIDPLQTYLIIDWS